MQCDDQVPACTNCRRSHLGMPYSSYRVGMPNSEIVCLIEDPATKRHQPRNYLETLEQRVALLEGVLREVQPNAISGYFPTGDSQQTQITSNEGQPNTRTTDDDVDSHDDLATMVGTLSLNAAGAEPHYLGSSSVFAFSRFMKPALLQVLSPIPRDFPGLDRQNLTTQEPCPLPDYQTAVRLSNVYFQNIHPQYPFLHEPTFRMWEASLQDPFETMNALNYSPVPLYFLNMVGKVHTLSGRPLKVSGVRCWVLVIAQLWIFTRSKLVRTSVQQSIRLTAFKQLYVSAMLYIDDILLQDNLECIQATLCCATYSLRASKGTSHW